MMGGDSLLDAPLLTLNEIFAMCLKVAAQPEEAIELYMAADRPRQALAILNQQLSSAMERGVDEAGSGLGSTGAGKECGSGQLASTMPVSPALGCPVRGFNSHWHSAP
jgi:hypothetical protein